MYCGTPMHFHIGMLNAAACLKDPQLTQVVLVKMEQVLMSEQSNAWALLADVVYGIRRWDMNSGIPYGESSLGKDKNVLKTVEKMVLKTALRNRETWVTGRNPHFKAAVRENGEFAFKLLRAAEGFFEEGSVDSDLDEDDLI